MPRVDLTGDTPTIRDNGNNLEVVLWTTKGSVARAQKIPGVVVTFYRGHHGIKATVSVSFDSTNGFHLNLTKLSQRKTSAQRLREVVSIFRDPGKAIYLGGNTPLKLRIDKKEEETIDNHLTMWR